MRGGPQLSSPTFLSKIGTFHGDFCWRIVTCFSWEESFLLKLQILLHLQIFLRISPLRVQFGVEGVTLGLRIRLRKGTVSRIYVAIDCRSRVLLEETGKPPKFPTYACKKVVVWFEKLGLLCVAADTKSWSLASRKAAIPPWRSAWSSLARSTRPLFLSPATKICPNFSN